MDRLSPSRVAARWIEGKTTPLPTDLGEEIALMTLEDFLDHRNPQGKHHTEESYDWTVEGMNRDYVRDLATVQSSGWGDPLSLSQGRKGYLLRDPDGSLVAVLHNGTWYYKDRAIGNRLPKGYPTREGYRDLPVKGSKRVKYLDEARAKVSDTIATNLASYPVILQRIKVKGEPFTVRAEKMPEKDKGVTLAILNEEGEMVAQASNEWGATLLVVGREYRGKGLGRVLGRFWYDLNPSFPSGGFTNSGMSNAVRLWEERVREFLARGWYSDLVRSGELSKAHLNEILEGLSGRKPRVEVERPAETKGTILTYVDYPTFILYDSRFLDDPYDEDAEDYIKGFGFFRDSPSVGTFLYTIDYDPGYKDLATLTALQMARDEGHPIYVGEGYGDLLEWEGIPGAEREGDSVQLTRDALSLDRLGVKESLVRRKVDPYEEKKYLLLEKADSKWR